MSNELTITKANSFVEASYQMTLDEMRVLSLTLGVFDPLNPSRRGFEFTIAEFCQHFPDVNPDIAYTQVQNAIRKISKRWITLVDNERELTEVSLIHKRSYFKKEGRFYIEFHEELIPYIANLKARYTRYELVNIGAFTSTHTIRFYELLSQYKTIGEREIKVEDLKDWLQVKDKYALYADFRKRVIEPSIDEINDKSDLLVNVDTIKRGRTIHALRFKIKIKTKSVTAKERPKFPHKNKYGKYVSLDRQNPRNSPAEYANYAKDCLNILDDYYHSIDQVTINDLRNYWVFLACNASFRSKLGNKQSMLEELRKRGFKLVDCELVEIDRKQLDLVDVELMV